MATLLHLTDIHLGENQNIDDHKAHGLSKPTDRHQRFNAYLKTIKAVVLHLTSNHMTLDAVIISGDITVTYDEKGYKLLEKLLHGLGKYRPQPSNIIITPGNHDVQWGLDFGNKDKYKHFITYVAAKGYCVPYLDGITNTKSKSPILLLDGGKVQLVPINTSHYCGSKRGFVNEALWEKGKQLLEENHLEKLVKEIEGRRIHDISRVSEKQLDYLSEKLGKITKQDEIFRIAIAHHPITPVSAHEEFKTFESITNLGELRQFLYNEDFKMILHGHKHTKAVFWDMLIDYEKTGQFHDYHNEKPILVISGSSLHEKGEKKEDIGRLIEISVNHSDTSINVFSFHATQVGNKLNITPQEYRVSNSKPALNTIIAGKNIHQTYAALLRYFALSGYDTNVTNLICEVQLNDGKIQVPDQYFGSDGKDTPTREELVIWIQHLVDWWGNDTKIINRGKPTHGPRLYHFGEGKIDQIKNIIEALKEKSGTSKGIAILSNPDEDSNSGDNGTHFCLIQFLLNKDKELNCIAYFRKQEMRHWWVVNIAEIVNLQKVIITGLSEHGLEAKFGGITTVAGVAYMSNNKSRPLVDIPKIDLLYDQQNRGKDSTLTELVFSLFYNTLPDKERFKNLWNDLFLDMLPKDKHDPNGVPVAIEGLQFISNLLQHLNTSKNNKKIDDLISDLTHLKDVNTNYNDVKKDYQKWKRDSEKLITKIKSQINTIYANKHSDKTLPKSTKSNSQKSSSKKTNKKKS